jgi:MFS family permease
MARPASPIVRIWSQRNFAVFAGGATPHLLAIWMQRLGVGWLAWELSHSTVWLGAVAAADLAPMLVLAPLAGAMTDRGRPLLQLKVAQAVIVVQALAVAGLTFAGWMTIELLFSLALVLGFVQPFSSSARNAVVPATVARPFFATAVALDSALFHTSRFIGPAIAGVLIPTAGVVGTFVAHFIGVTIFLAELFALDLPESQPERHEVSDLMRDIRDSFAYVRGHAGIWPVFLLLGVVSVLIRPLQDMLPGFAGAVFHAGPVGLAWLTSSMGVGAMASATWIAVRGHTIGLTHNFILGCLGVALSTLGFALAGYLWIAVPFAALSGFALNTMSTGTQALVQSAVADHMRGRVMSLYTLVFRGLPAIGTVGIGVLAESLGLRLTFVIAAGLCFVAWLVALPRRQTLAAALEAEPGERSKEISAE